MSPADNIPGGGDVLAAAIAAQLIRKGRRAERSGTEPPTFLWLANAEPSEADRTEPRNAGERRPGEPGGSSAGTVSDEAAVKLVRKSLRESIGATGEWMIQTGLKIGAHCICPGAGHLVTLAFEIKEVLDDVAALSNPDSPCELHVPLVHLAPGIVFEADVQLGNGAEEDGPRLSVFVVPGDGGIFGGWALERDNDHKAAGQAAPKTEQEAPVGAGVVHADLSQAVDASDDLRMRAAILRESASRLQSQLWTMPEYSGVSLMVIYDDQADLGMWLVRPEAIARISAWQIELGSDAETGLLMARVRV